VDKHTCESSRSKRGGGARRDFVSGGDLARHLERMGPLRFTQAIISTTIKTQRPAIAATYEVISFCRPSMLTVVPRLVSAPATPVRLYAPPDRRVPSFWCMGRLDEHAEFRFTFHRPPPIAPRRRKKKIPQPISAQYCVPTWITAQFFRAGEKVSQHYQSLSKGLEALQ